MDKYKGLADYLRFVTENYKLEICINDFAGFLRVDPQLSAVLQPYLIHKNPFCMHVKSHSTQLWNRCLRMKRGILLKSEKLKKTYYGMCYCGVEEYIVPILCGDIVIGVICAGEFCTHKDIAAYRIGKISAQYSMGKDILLDKFYSSVSDESFSPEFIDTLLGIAAGYFSNLYNTLVTTHQSGQLKDVKGFSSETYILSHAIEYIKRNFHEKITIRDISAFCHCSESYISHTFKRNMKVNIKTFINKLRIEQAKEFLLNSNDSIAEIAIKTGFNDPNYFSCVFSELCGITPTEFKRRFVKA